MYYAVIRRRYINHEITAADVWAYADAGKITERQALLICGQRP